MGYKFYYFDLYVRGEPIRMLLDQAGVEWEDKRVGFPEWPNLKPTMPNGQVPALEMEDGTKLGESMAILRLLAMKHGFYPEDPMEAFRCDEMMDAYNDVIGKIYTPHFANSQEAKEAKYPEIFDTVMPNLLKAIDAQCAKGEFIAGKNLTAADFCIGGLYTNYLANKDISFAPEKWSGLLAQFPNFKAYGERFVGACKRMNGRKGCPV